jgi:hypothetical protein
MTSARAEYPQGRQQRLPRHPRARLAAVGRPRPNCPPPAAQLGTRWVRPRGDGSTSGRTPSAGHAWMALKQTSFAPEGRPPPQSPTRRAARDEVGQAAPAPGRRVATDFCRSRINDADTKVVRASRRAAVSDCSAEGRPREGSGRSRQLCGHRSASRLGEPGTPRGWPMRARGAARRLARCDVAGLRRRARPSRCSTGVRSGSAARKPRRVWIGRSRGGGFERTRGGRGLSAGRATCCRRTCPPGRCGHRERLPA